MSDVPPPESVRENGQTKAPEGGANGEAKAPEGAAGRRVDLEPVDLDALIEAEKAAIETRRGFVYTEEAVTAANLTGLSLSGGGIRSACFNLGLLEKLDRLAYGDRPSEAKLKPEGEKPGGINHLELFDYVSSVSGGSYAAGHLATAMLPSNPKAKPGPGKKSETPEWLGKVPLTSKTVPGWLWGVGVWFLGVSFQLLKTGSLLVCFLALVAFGMRTLDAPDAMRFCGVLGIGSDVSRGFVPFWFALGIFLVAYWINVSKWEKWVTIVWFAHSAAVVCGYVAVIWWTHDDFPASSTPLPHWVHYAFLMALPAPVVGVCLWIVASQAVKGLRAAVFKVRAAEGRAVEERPDRSWVDTLYVPLRSVLLIPLLVALFCIAGLVTTGDIGFTPLNDDPARFSRAQEKLAEAQQWIYKAALSALGVTSLAFLFPKKLFKSARTVEDRDSGKETLGARRRGLEPIFRVVVFLCSYGFVLLVVFVLYSTVSGEDVSGYYDWRNNVPSAAFLRSDYRDADLAWERIARDDEAARSRPDDWPPPANWGSLASRLMKARAVDYSLNRERALAAEIEILESMPWLVRLFPFTMDVGPAGVGPAGTWAGSGLRIDRSASRLYDAKAEQTGLQEGLARRIADSVLRDPDLYKVLPPFDEAFRGGSVEEPESSKYRAQWEKYVAKAKGLATLRRGETAFQAAIRNNNRLALRLYLGDLVRDRQGKKLVYASIVWAQDQWTRLRIALITGVLWVLCCAVDVNSFSLQKFYRGHVIDSWVKIPKGKSSGRWLHETIGTYRGYEYRGHEPDLPTPPPTRRAPLLLINTTQEGNRSLGDEPDLPGHIFTFSPIASGSGSTRYWLNGDDPRKSLARRSDLDIGNIVATSGAFLSPGSIANPALSAVLHLLNIQTGYWAHDPRDFERRSPLESLGFHVSQSLGADCEGDSRFMLTDGAHVENLGLYVLLQRRCSLIVASDCSQEDRDDKAERRFDALIQVLQQAEVDGIKVGPFLNSRAYRRWIATGQIKDSGGQRGDCRRARSTGLNLVRPTEPAKPTAPANAGERDKLTIVLPTEPAKGAPASPTGNAPSESGGKKLTPAGRDAAAAGETFARQHYVFAQIVYPPDASGKRHRGLLVYLRPTLTGDEGDALLHGSADCRFPDDDPMDQFYTPAKMSTYRLLGRHIAWELMRDPVMKKSLGRIVRGKPATSKPGQGKPDDATVNCETECIDNASCVLNRQRIVRRGRYGNKGSRSTKSHATDPTNGTCPTS